MHSSMTSFAAKLIFCSFIFFASNAFAQNVKVDDVNGKFVGRKIDDYAGTTEAIAFNDQFDKKTNMPAVGSVSQGETKFKCNKQRQVYCMAVWGHPKDTNALGKSAYKKYAALYYPVVKSLGKADSVVSKYNTTLLKWKGANGYITALEDEDENLLKIEFYDRRLEDK